MLSDGCVLCDDNLVCASDFFLVRCASFDHYCTLGTQGVEDVYKFFDLTNNLWDSDFQFRSY